MKSRQSIIKDEPENAIALAILGASFIEMGGSLVELGLSYMDKSISISPDYEWALGVKGRALYLYGKYSEAVDIFEQQYQLGGDLSKNAIAGKALALNALGKEEEANRANLIALGDQPDSDTYLHRAYAIGNLGAHRLASEDCLKAIELDKKNASAYNYYAWIISTELGENLEDCTQKATRAVELATDSINKANNLDTLGWVWHLRGNEAKAKKYLDEAVDINPIDLVIRTHQKTVKDKLKTI